MLAESIDLPKNIEAEQAILGSALVNNAVVERAGLEAADFTEPAHGELWHWIASRVASGELADPVTARRHFDASPAFTELGGARYLASIARAAETIINAVEYARLVRDLAQRRRLIAAADDIRRKAADPQCEQTCDELAAEAMASIEAMPRLGRTRTATLRELACRLADDLDRPAEVMRTGVRALDEILGGGIWSGKLYGIAARMKVGKTVLLATVARNVARAGVPVAYLALEMGQAEVAQRVIADAIGVNSARFLRRDEPDLADRVVGYASRSDAPELDALRFVDTPGCTLSSLRAIVADIIATHRPRLMALDYWQLVGGCPKGWAEAQHLAAVAQWLADTTRRHNVAILTAAQINRQGETRGSDGLRLACDWYGHMHPAAPNDETDRWVETLDSRYTLRLNAGSPERAALRVCRTGPVLRDW